MALTAEERTEIDNLKAEVLVSRVIIRAYVSAAVISDESSKNFVRAMTEGIKGVLEDDLFVAVDSGELRKGIVSRLNSFVHSIGGPVRAVR